MVFDLKGQRSRVNGSHNLPFGEMNVDPKIESYMSLNMEDSTLGAVRNTTSDISKTKTTKETKTYDLVLLEMFSACLFA